MINQIKTREIRYSTKRLFLSLALALLAMSFAQPSAHAQVASVGTFNALRNASQTIINGGYVYVISNATLGDGGSGFFRYSGGKPAGTFVDDNGLTIVPAGGNGSAAWIRDYVGDIQLSWYIGVLTTGLTAVDITTPLRSAIAAAAAEKGGQGKTVFIDTGAYFITSTIILPNRVALRGANGRGSIIKAANGFSGQAMFYAVNGTTSMFGSFLSDLFIDADDNANICVQADAWQESCGMLRVVLQGFKQVGLVIQIGHGGAAYLKLRDIEIFGTSATATDGIRVNQVSSVGAFKLHIEGASITGVDGNQLPRAIYMVKDTLIAEGLHFEYVDIGVLAAGPGSVSLDTVMGSFNLVQNLVAFGSTFTGRANLRNLIGNGTTNFIVLNNATGVHVLASAGSAAQYTQ